MKIDACSIYSIRLESESNRDKTLMAAWIEIVTFAK